MFTTGFGARLAAPLGTVVVVTILLLGAGTAGACQSPPTPTYTVLTTIPLVDAVAANSSEVFAQGVANCGQIWGILPNGTVYLYATVPVQNSQCDEGALALAPSPCTNSTNTTGPLPGYYLPDWHHHHGGSAACGKCPNQSSGDVLYDVVAGRLFEITENGTNVTQLATFPTSHKASENLGLAYDQVGDFAHDLIVTSSSGGNVWTYNVSNGSTTLLVKLHTYIGGPAVAPTSFWPFGGDVVIAEKEMGEIVAVSPNGTVSEVANWSKANAVTFPSFGGGHGKGRGYGDWQYNYGNGGCAGGCSFGPEHYVLFVANYSSGAVEAFPASDLQGYYGDGFVAGGLNQGIGAFDPYGYTSYFANNTERLSDIASVVCFPPPCGCDQQGQSGNW